MPPEDDVRFHEEHSQWTSPRSVEEEVIDDTRFSADRYYNGERDSVLLFQAGRETAGQNWPLGRSDLRHRPTEENHSHSRHRYAILVTK